MSSAPMDWSTYQKLADELAARPEEECLRSAISRGYYAVLHQCRDRLVKNGTPLRERYAVHIALTTITHGGTHKQVWDGFAKSKDPECIRLAAWGKVLKGKRENADYDTQFPGRIDLDAPLIVVETAKFAADLAKIPSHLPTYP